MKAELRRHQFLKAAAKVFLKKGFHTTRIQDLVAEAKTGKGTFYLHFKNKEEVFLALLQAFFSELKACLSKFTHIVSAEKSTMPQTGSYSIDKLYLDHAMRVFKTLEKHQATARLLFRDGQSAGSKIEKVISKFFSEMIVDTAGHLKIFTDLGILPKSNPKIMACCMIGAIERLYQTWLSQGVTESRETVVNEALKFSLRGAGLGS